MIQAGEAWRGGLRGMAANIAALAVLCAYASHGTRQRHRSVRRESTCILSLSAVCRLHPTAFARVMRVHAMACVAASLVLTHTALRNYTHISTLLYLLERVSDAMSEAPDVVTCFQRKRASTKAKGY